jgi:aldehyde:ferredoxin oxidoreductase
MEAGVAEFGDAEAAIHLIKEVGQGTPLGRILGSGAAVTGQVYGIERVPVVKKQAMPAYDPRGVQGIGVTYATTPMGADHTSGYAVGANILGTGGKLDPLKPEGQIELARNLQIATAILTDSIGMCLFVAFPILDQPETLQALVDLVNAFSAQNLTAEDLLEQGKAILKMERDFNFRAGFTEKDDRLPEYFKKEKLPPHDITFQVKDEDLDEVFNF